MLSSFSGQVTVFICILSDVKLIKMYKLIFMATLMFFCTNAYVYEFCDQKAPMPGFDIDKVMNGLITLI